MQVDVAHVVGPHEQRIGCVVAPQVVVAGALHDESHRVVAGEVDRGGDVRGRCGGYGVGAHRSRPGIQPACRLGGTREALVHERVLERLQFRRAFVARGIFAVDRRRHGPDESTSDAFVEFLPLRVGRPVLGSGSGAARTATAGVATIGVRAAGAQRRGARSRSRSNQQPASAQLSHVSLLCRVLATGRQPAGRAEPCGHANPSPRRTGAGRWISHVTSDLTVTQQTEPLRDPVAPECELVASRAASPAEGRQASCAPGDVTTGFGSGSAHGLAYNPRSLPRRKARKSRPSSSDGRAAVL